MNRKLLEQALAALQHMINNTRAMSEYNPMLVIAAEDALIKYLDCVEPTDEDIAMPDINEQAKEAVK